MTVNALACPMNPRYTIRETIVSNDEHNHDELDDGGDVVDSSTTKRPRQTADVPNDVHAATTTPAKKK